MTKAPIPVTFLLTTGGGPGILAQVEALRASTHYRARVILADANPASGNLFLPQVDAAYRIPLCHDPDFIPSLLRLIARERIDYLYSGLDEEMPVIARSRHLLEAAGCRLLLPSANALDAALDKIATHRLVAQQVRLPLTAILDGHFDPERFWETAGGKVLIKVAASRGGRHIYIPEDWDEYVFFIAKARKIAAANGVRFIVQRFIQGVEYNTTTLHDAAGRAVYAISRRKFESRQIKSTTTAAVIEQRQDVIDQALAAVKALDLVPGFNNIESIVSEQDGLAYFIEINGGRTAAQDMNIVASGINVTDLLMDLASGRDVARLPHPADGLAILKIRKDVLVQLQRIENLPVP